MIEINLLPESLRKKQIFQFNLPQGKRIPFVGLVIAFFILPHILLPVCIGINSFRLKRAEAALKRIGPQKQQVDALKLQVDAARGLEALDLRLGQERFLSSPKLNAVSDSLSDGVWLEELTFSKEALEIKGSCYSLEGQELTQIGNFLNALKSDSSIAKDFPRLELVSVQRRKLGAIEVVDFAISSKMQGKAETERR